MNRGAGQTAANAPVAPEILTSDNGEPVEPTTATVTEIVAGADVEAIVTQDQPSETPEESTPPVSGTAPETAAEDAGEPVDVDTGAAETRTPVPETPQTTRETDDVATALADTATETADKPTFDVVRVDNSGMAVIAGTAAPNATVTITANGEEIGEAVASSSGEFVAILDTDNSEEAQNIALESEVDGTLQFSDETILILPTLNSDAAEEVADTPPAPPVIVKATAQEVVVIQPSAPLQVDQVSIDSISYEETGEAAVAGRGTPFNMVIAYVDNDAVAKAEVSALGSWKVILDGLEAGTYTLRIDELDAAGKVVSRMETPFQRAFPADVAQAQVAQVAAGGDAKTTYTVQPGNSLWVIATGQYGVGAGLKYHQIFAANRDKIRDPDLIYPGQVFVLPEAAE